MKEVKAFFKGMAKVLGLLVYLWVLVISAACVAVLLAEAEYMLAGLSGGVMLLYLWCGVKALHGENLWRAICGMLLCVMFVFGCAYIGGGRHLASAEDFCSDLGVCSEEVISAEECKTQDGRWLRVGEKWFCYMKWSVVKTAEVEAKNGETR